MCIGHKIAYQKSAGKMWADELQPKETIDRVFDLFCFFWESSTNNIGHRNYEHRKYEGMM
jgi:hypothetical protein